MSSSVSELILPRPGTAPSHASSPPTPIRGPDEASFTNTFGTLLPPAQYLTTANGRAAYYEIRPTTQQSGLPVPDRVLFVHGIQTPALGMLPLARALQNSFTSSHLVLIDLWGHGLTDTPILPHESSLFHKLLDALLDQLDWPSAHLVGYSLGGVLTVGYVNSRVSRVKSFVLVVPAGLIQSSGFTTEQQGYLRGHDEIGAKKWVFEFLESGQLTVPANWKERVEAGEVVAEAVRDWEMRNHAGHAASVIAIFRDSGVMDSDAAFVKAARMNIPSLAVLGATDDVCSEQQLREVGFTNIAVVPEAGHTVVRDRVPEVATLISKFWAKLNKSSPE